MPFSVVLMSMAFIGIMALQVVWFKQAYDLKSREFDNYVSHALLEAGKKIDEYELRGMFMNNLNEFNYYNPSGSMGNVTRDKQTGQLRINILNLSQDTNETYRQSLQLNGSVETQDSAERNSRHVRLPDGSIISWKSRNLGNANLSHDDLRELKYKENAFRIFSRVMTEMEFMFAEGYRKTDPVAADSILSVSLANEGIHTDYEFGFYLPDRDTLSYISPGASVQKLKESPFVFRLYQDDLFAPPQFLLLYLNDKQEFIFNSMNYIIILFLIFSIIVISVYTYTIRTLVKQKKISEMKTDFINNMTHEFKTPIASISLAADSLLNQKVIHQPDLIKHYSNLIKEENRRMNRHIEAVLQSAVLDKGTLELRKEEVYIHELLEMAAEKARFQTGNALILLELGATRQRMIGDEMHLLNVFANLLDNAIKYCTRQPEIVIKTENTGDDLLIHFKDNGIGIRKEDLKEIFKKFYRVPTGNVHNVKGFGLGLNYVRSIVQMHGGSITAESELGVGSEFTITIPNIFS